VPKVRSESIISLNVEMKSPIISKDLIEYLEANHNLMIFADAEAKKPVRMLANEFGVEFEAAVSGIQVNIVRATRFVITATMRMEDSTMFSRKISSSHLQLLLKESFHSQRNQSLSVVLDKSSIHRINMCSQSFVLSLQHSLLMKKKVKLQRLQVTQLLSSLGIRHETIKEFLYLDLFQCVLMTVFMKRKERYIIVII